MLVSVVFLNRTSLSTFFFPLLERSSPAPPSSLHNWLLPNSHVTSSKEPTLIFLCKITSPSYSLSYTLFLFFRTLNLVNLFTDLFHYEAGTWPDRSTLRLNGLYRTNHENLGLLFQPRLWASIPLRKMVAAHCACLGAAQLQGCTIHMACDDYGAL